jgi:hypothetical protein
MNARPNPAQKVTPLGSDRTGAKPSRPRKMVAYYLGTACEHDWARLEPELQTLEAEGKTIWKCRSCSEITNTYDWQTP